MASRGRGRRGRPQCTGQAPPTFDQPPAFDQQAFVEVVGVAAVALAQASIAGSQGDPSNPRGLGRIILRHSQGGRSDGGRPLVYADREGVRGDRDYL